MGFVKKVGDRGRGLGAYGRVDNISDCASVYGLLNISTFACEVCAGEGTKDLS